mmetsp:Transcript_118318/g.339537  ORF Transcript_118318/g.339537 Transcript_118318/m.339537 type:complete len:229 (-) Transcript_118318:8-694(-)
MELMPMWSRLRSCCALTQSQDQWWYNAEHVNIVMRPNPWSQKQNCFFNESPAAQEVYANEGAATQDSPAPVKLTIRSARSSRREYFLRGGEYHWSFAWRGSEPRRCGLEVGWVASEPSALVSVSSLALEDGDWRLARSSMAADGDVGAAGACASEAAARDPHECVSAAVAAPAAVPMLPPGFPPLLPRRRQVGESASVVVATDSLQRRAARRRKRFHDCPRKMSRTDA